MADISAQGLLTGSGTTTNVAIDGNGFFPVRDSLDGGDVYYTRNGEFSVDSDGHLTNGGFYLLGWRTDADGNVTSRMIEPIDVNSIASTAAATTEVAIKANLPADAAASATVTFNTTIDLYDLRGAAHSMEITWTKTAENTWRADLRRSHSCLPILHPSAVSVTSGPITITFNPDGTLLSTIFFSNGLSHDHGQQLVDRRRGQHHHPRSRSSGDCDRAEPVRVGPAPHTRCRPRLARRKMASTYGKLRSVAIDDHGLGVSCLYSNGQQIALFKILSRNLQ